MKKKYFTPELEEVKIDGPVLLEMGETSPGTIPACPTKSCEADDCPTDEG